MDYYVYSHTRKDNGRCFYIGMGRAGRVKNTTERNKHYKQVLEEAGGMVPIILISGLSKEKAIELERDIISQVGKKNLTNIHKGGTGGFDFVTSEHRKKRLETIDWDQFRAAVSNGKKKYIWIATKDNTSTEYSSLKEMSKALGFWFNPVHRHFKNKTEYKGYTFTRRHK